MCGCVPHIGKGKLFGDGIRPPVPVGKALELISPGLEIFPWKVAEVPDPGGVGLAKILCTHFCEDDTAEELETRRSNGHVIRGGSPYSLPEFLLKYSGGFTAEPKDQGLPETCFLKFESDTSKRENGQFFLSEGQSVRTIAM